MDSQQSLILSMDTSTPCSAVALTEGTRADGRVVASLSLTGNVTHSRRLFTAIDYIMKEAAVNWPDIVGIAVSLGPGSFTGLRIGMATAKGLAAAAGKPLFGVSTLDSLAAKCVSPCLICPILDARKKEVYSAFYRCGSNGFTDRISDMTVLAPSELASKIEEPVLLVGDGALVYGKFFRETLGTKALFAPAVLHEPSAASLGLLAGEMYETGRQLDLAEAVPVYIRSSDAELNLKQKKKKMLATENEKNQKRQKSGNQ